MSMERSDLHDWLAYREQLAARLTVADSVVRNVEAATVDRAPAQGRRGRMLLVVAAAAAVLFAGIGIPRLALVHHGYSPNPAGPPTNVPDQRPRADMPLIWVGDPSNPQRAIALDRNGAPVGWLRVSFMMSGDYVAQSADGQRILTGEGERYELTAQGRRIDLPQNALHDGGNVFQQFPLYFSDDDRSLCLEQGVTGTARNLLLIDGNGQVSATWPEAPADSPPGLSWGAATCSVRNDVAVLIADPHPRAPAGGPSHMVRVIRLSTGKEIARRTYTAGLPAPIDASTDGTLVLERTTMSTYTLRNIATGAVLGTLDTGGGEAKGLLGNTTAIVQGPVPSSGPHADYLVDIPSGVVIWSAMVVNGLPDFIDASTVVTVDSKGLNCPTHADITISDLRTGDKRRTTLNTCGQS